MKSFIDDYTVGSALQTPADIILQTFT